MVRNRILLIDDDIDFCRLLRRKVEGWGYDAVIAHNWLSVTVKLRLASFDAIVADVDTPTGNGLNVFEFLNKDPEVEYIPKIFVTGRCDAETVKRCIALDAEYLHKSPILFDELEKYLERVLEDSASRLAIH
jgi:DNA-binding NtrC family response regulator